MDAFQGRLLLRVERAQNPFFKGETDDPGLYVTETRAPVASHLNFEDGWPLPVREMRQAACHGVMKYSQLGCSWAAADYVTATSSGARRLGGRAEAPGAPSR